MHRYVVGPITHKVTIRDEASQSAPQARIIKGAAARNRCWEVEIRVYSYKVLIIKPKHTHLTTLQRNHPTKARITSSVANTKFANPATSAARPSSQTGSQ